MHARFIAAAVSLIVAAVALNSAVAGPAATTKQRVLITSDLAAGETFVLTPLNSGPLKTDSGSASIAFGAARNLVRDGQGIAVYRPTFTFTGKLGTLVLRERNEWVSVARPGREYPQIAIGTWKVVRGTGQYAGITGAGRSGHVGLGSPWYVRQEGFLSSN